MLAAPVLEAEDPAARRNQVFGLGRFARVATLLLDIEPLILLAIAPLLWFPRWWSGFLLLVIPVCWILRWLMCRRLSVRTIYDMPMALLVLFLPLTLFPVVEWGAAMPKLYSMLLGVALIYALANALPTLKWSLAGLYVTIVVLGGGLAAGSLVSTEWPPPSKLAPFGFIYHRLPLLVRGLVPATQTGAVHPNEIGGALTIFVPLAAAAVLAHVRRVRALSRALPLLATLAVCSMLVLVVTLTQSRSAYFGCALGLLIVLGWWLVGERTSKRGRQLGSVLVMLFAVPAGLAVWRLVTIWTSLQTTNSDSLPSRFEVWERSLEMLRDFPFTGIGMGQFSMVLHGLYVPFLLRSAYVPHAHNFFLQLGLDLGIPGAMAMLFVFGRFFAAMFRVARWAEQREVRAAAVGLAGGMLAFLTYGLTDAIAIGARGAIGVWVVLGLGAALFRAASLSMNSIGCEHGLPRTSVGGDEHAGS